MSTRVLTLAPVIFLILWSGGYGVAAFGLAYAEPMTMLSLRFALVLLIMVPAYFIMRPPLPQRLADWGQSPQAVFGWQHAPIQHEPSQISAKTG